MIQFNETKLASIIEGAVEKSLNRLLPIALKDASRKKWLTTTEVMQLIDCSRRHVQYLRDTGQISYSKNNRIIRYDVEEIDRYLAANRINYNDKPAAAPPF